MRSLTATTSRTALRRAHSADPDHESDSEYYVYYSECS